MLGVIPLVREHRADAGHDGKGGQEQPLEDMTAKAARNSRSKTSV
jgi:hypothetical protein